MSSVISGDDLSLKNKSIQSENNFSMIKDLSLVKASHSKNKSYDIKNIAEINFMKSTLESENSIENSNFSEEITIKLCFMSSKFCKMRKIGFSTFLNYNKFKSFSIKEMLGFKSFLDTYYSKINMELFNQTDPIIRIVGYDEKGNSYDIKSEEEWVKLLNKIRFGGSFNDSNMISSYLKTGKPKFYIILKNESEIKLELGLKNKNEFFFNDALDIIYESIIKDKRLKCNLVEYIKDDDNNNNNVNHDLVELDQTIIKQDKDYDYLIMTLFEELKKRNKFHDDVKACVQNYKKDNIIDNSKIDFDHNENQNDNKIFLKLKLESHSLKLKIGSESNEDQKND